MNSNRRQKNYFKVKIYFWNIESRHYLLIHKNMQKYLQSYDIIFLCETHALLETKLFLPGFVPFNNPCKISNQKYPRGGTIFFVK